MTSDERRAILASCLIVASVALLIAGSSPLAFWLSVASNAAGFLLLRQWVRCRARRRRRCGTIRNVRWP